MLPEWLLQGLAIAGVLAVVFAVLFAVGERLFPSARQRAAGPSTAGSSAAGEWKRRQEIREYLSAVGERFVEDQFVGGQRVAFYLPERDVAITFDARAYFRLDGSPTHAILVEHEMPGTHLGGRLPFETPDPATAEVDALGAAFAVLGLAPDATPADVKAAYREKVKEAHPDHGGDPETFRRVREAYTAAKQHAS